ncbi:MAG: DUF411 domain-containing protein [Pseudomonadota bacterium]
MMPRTLAAVIAALLTMTVLAGCSGEASTPDPQDAIAELVVHKTPTCGCCSDWVEYMREAGFAVEVREQADLTTVKERVGVPYGLGSCHTAEVAGYFIEGHVPAEDVARLLTENPDARGLSVPGMPLGSPGMEVPSGEVEPYEVLLVGTDGQTSVFARHGS